MHNHLYDDSVHKMDLLLVKWKAFPVTEELFSKVLSDFPILSPKDGWELTLGWHQCSVATWLDIDGQVQGPSSFP